MEFRPRMRWIPERTHVVLASSGSCWKPLVITAVFTDSIAEWKLSLTYQLPLQSLLWTSILGKQLSQSSTKPSTLEINWITH